MFSSPTTKSTMTTWIEPLMRTIGSCMIVQLGSFSAIGSFLIRSNLTYTDSQVEIGGVS